MIYDPSHVCLPLQVQHLPLHFPATGAGSGVGGTLGSSMSMGGLGTHQQLLSWADRTFQTVQSQVKAGVKNMLRSQKQVNCELDIFLSSSPRVCWLVRSIVNIKLFCLCLRHRPIFSMTTLLSIYLYVRLSLHLSVCLSVYLFIGPSVYLSVRLSVCLFVYLFVCLSVCLSIHLFVCLSDWLSVCRSVSTSLDLSIYLPIYLCICLSPFLLHNEILYYGCFVYLWHCWQPLTNTIIYTQYPCY